MRNFAKIILVCVLMLSLVSCFSTGSQQDEKGDSSKVLASPRFTVAEGALAGTYLKEPWPSYEHGTPIKDLYYSKGVILMLTESNELIKLDQLTGLPNKQKLQLKNPLQFPPVVYQYSGTGGADAVAEMYFFQDGDILWCVEADSLQELWVENLGYGVSCSPAVSDETIMICAEGGRINCLRKENRRDLWTYMTAKTVSAPPIVSRDMIYVNSEDGNAYGMSVSGGWLTGGRSWEGNTKARIVTSPVIYKQKVFSASLDRKLYMFDEVNGDVVGEYHIGQLVTEQPYASKNTVFLIGDEDPELPRTMYAINATSGESRWKRTMEGAGDASFEVDGVPNVGKLLTVGKDLVYVLSEDWMEIWGLRIADGTRVHTLPLSEKPDFVISHDADRGRDAANFGLIVLGTKSGKILVLKERRVY